MTRIKALIIYVDDSNDQAPVFQSTTYTETIGEDWPIGERVLVVTASDKDQGINAELSYALSSECLVRNPHALGTSNNDNNDDCAHTFIMQVKVQDRDSGPNGQIEWRLSNPNFYLVDTNH